MGNKIRRQLKQSYPTSFSGIDEQGYPPIEFDEFQGYNNNGMNFPMYGNQPVPPEPYPNAMLPTQPNMTPLPQYNPNTFPNMSMPTQHFMPTWSFPSSPRPIPAGPPVLVGSTSSSFLNTGSSFLNTGSSFLCPQQNVYDQNKELANIITGLRLSKELNCPMSSSHPVFQIKIPSLHSCSIPAAASNPPKPLLLQIIDRRSRPSVVNSDLLFQTQAQNFPRNFSMHSASQNKLPLLADELLVRNRELMRENRELRIAIHNYRRDRRPRNSYRKYFRSRSSRESRSHRRGHHRDHHNDDDGDRRVKTRTTSLRSNDESRSLTDRIT